MLKLIIPVVPPAPNELMRMYHMDRYKLMNMWAWEVKVALMDTEVTIERATQKKKILIFQYRKRKIRDLDNLYASCKPVLDALTKNFLIVDDSEKWIDFKVRQEIDSKRVRTEITIT